MEQQVKYSDTEINAYILKAVREMGFEYMTPIQEQAIPVLLEGKDVIGQAQTGTGKTAAFSIPMIQKIDISCKKPQGIILCPTRELAMQAAEEIRKITKYMHGLKVLPVYGGQDISKQIRALSQGVQIIVGTPGRVMDHLRRHTIKTANVQMIVLDEADEMLNMGFREDMETILSQMPEEHQMALFSATMPQAILEITNQYQKDAVFIKVTPKEVTVAAIEQSYYRIARKDKMNALCRLIDFHQPRRSLIFCNTKKMVDEMTQELKGRGYEAEGLHGDLSQFQRDTVMNLFRSGRCAILIATDVAARGIDVSGVDAVFNYDVPEDIEYYVHRIGRTGRAGREGKSMTLVSGREVFKIRDIERICHTRIEEKKLPTGKDIVKVKFRHSVDSALEAAKDQNLEGLKNRIESVCDEKWEFRNWILQRRFFIRVWERNRKRSKRSVSTMTVTVVRTTAAGKERAVMEESPVIGEKKAAIVIRRGGAEQERIREAEAATGKSGAARECGMQPTEMRMEEERNRRSAGRESQREMNREMRELDRWRFFQRIESVECFK